jgi:tetratricopeptide (TPR) repeat protein
MPSRFMLGVIVATVFVGCTGGTAKQPTTAPLYENLGSHHHPVTTSSAEAQQYFDQGLRLSYAFNHAEAIRSFRQAAALDPDCAMCYWGVAFALGPNINAPITEEAAREAFQAIEDARRRSGGVSDRERAYVEALAIRYTSDPKAERPPLDTAYATAMRDVASRFPDDLDAATLFAQSLMDTSPWNYWDIDGTPRAFTQDVLDTLESVLSKQPDHLGAIHLYIHAVEASPDPRRAERYADKLAALAPGAGHLVHMPAHIYLRVGRYADASAANEDAIKADEAYVAGDAAPNNMTYQVGYVPHNVHFFVTSASMEGRSADALKAAADVRNRMHDDMLRDPSMGGMVQHMSLTPLFVKVRFARWPDVLAEAAPPNDLLYMTAMWHWARGMAHAAQNQLPDARRALTSLATLKDDQSLKTLVVSSVNAAASIVGIAQEVLAAEIATAERRAAVAARHFGNAAKLEDALIYMEPPDWPIPARQLQGAALLKLGRLKEAEAAFRRDLRKFPENGWSLSGLSATLERQGRAREAAEVTKCFTAQWQRADVQLVDAKPKPTD